MNSKHYKYHLTSFLTSAPDIHHLPRDTGIEIAFTGRSNAGKSSVVNTLTNQKNLARTSKTPGCTQLINIFEIEQGYRLVDLPGYGYAQLPKKIKIKWQRALGEYLHMRKCLKGLVVIMDIRHPLQDLDKEIIQWAVQARMPQLVLLTKDDKLSSSTRNTKLNMVREAMLHFMDNIQVETFSARNRTGVLILIKKLNTWFNKTSLDVL